MRIAYITAGAGHMYCGSCLRDNTLAMALRAAGHDVQLIPTYTPTRTDEANASHDRVFLGASTSSCSSTWRCSAGRRGCSTGCSTRRPC